MAGFATPDLSHVRSLFGKSYNSEASANELFMALKDVSDHGHPLLTGYKGMSEIMLCPHVWSPVAKLGHFNKGKKLLELAIVNDPQNAELRFLRFSVQTNVPAILRYNRNISEDKKVLVLFLDNRQKHENAVVYNMVLHYMLQSGHCTRAEKERFRGYL